MDLRLFTGVLRRDSRLVLAGVGIALVLAILSFVRISPTGLAYRQHEVWSSSAILLLTTHGGFPWGRSEGSSNGYPELAALTDLYAQFANSDDVKRIMRRRGAPKTWRIKAVSVQPASPYNGAPPLISLGSTAFSARQSVQAARVATSALVSYLTTRQSAAGIPAAERVKLQVLQAGTKPVVVEPRRKTLPIMVFLAIVSLTVALAFVRHNLEQRQMNESAEGPVMLAGAVPPREPAPVATEATSAEAGESASAGAGRWQITA